jgi:hypothetical protein
MATLEEIAQQFENALGTETGTTIAPGTITPVGVTASGKKKLSWAEVVQKMADNTGLTSNQLLPDVPKGVTAQTFYRTGVKSGMLPQGLATFTSSPFGSFRGRMGVSQGATTGQATSSSSSATLAPAPVAVPKSAIQTQQDSWTMSDMEQSRNSALNPNVDPNFGFGNVLSFLAAPVATIMGSVLGKDSKDDDESKGNPHFNYGTFTKDEIGYLIDNNMMNDAQQTAYTQGIDRMDINGNAVDSKGYAYAKDSFSNTAAYNEEENKRVNNFFLTKYQRQASNSTGLDFGGNRRAPFTEGYQLQNDPTGANRWSRGNYVEASGRVNSTGNAATFLGLISENLAMANKVADMNRERFGRLNPESERALAQANARNPEKRVKTIDRSKSPALTPDPAKAPALNPNYVQNNEPYSDYSWDDYSSPDATDDFGSGSFGDPGAGEDGQGSSWASGGEIKRMANGGEAMPQQQQPQAQGAEAEMANLGMINEQAAEPQNGGQQSVKDDVPREADEGDYILPYETVLEVGLKQLNRYAKEAIQLAIKNGVNLKGTDLDPTDDVPIKVSNYEFHIPKGLVPYFGGGKKYLDKIRDEGLALRKRLEEEKQPSAQQQQPMQPPQPQAAPASAPEPQMMDAPQQAPQMPMMAEGGFVDDPKQAIKSAEQALVSDTSQPTQSAYNQVQAIKRASGQGQQPPMVDPNGQVVQQGFAAPQGYALGGDVLEPVEQPLPSETEQPLTPDPLPEQPPSTQMETSAAPADEVQVAQDFQAFDRAFKQATEQGVRNFEFDGKQYSTVKLEDKNNFNKLKTIEIEKLMALTALGEARSENRAGMQAVMHVINNRVKANNPGEFGSGYDDPFRSVILHPGAFTALRGFEMGNTKDEKYRKNFSKFMDVGLKDNSYKEAVEDARLIMNGELEDITNGSKFYFNPETVELPRHLKGMDRKTVIGRHHFYNRGGFVERVGDTVP